MYTIQYTLEVILSGWALPSPSPSPSLFCSLFLGTYHGAVQSGLPVASRMGREISEREKGGRGLGGRWGETFHHTTPYTRVKNKQNNKSGFCLDGGGTRGGEGGRRIHRS